MRHEVKNLERVMGSIESSPMASQYLPILSFAFSAITEMPNYAPELDLPPNEGVRVDDVVSKVVPIEISTLHFYSTSVHTISISCIVWLQYTARQTV